MCVGVCEGGSGLLGGEVVRSESWRVERESWLVERRDGVERLVSGYNIIGRCGLGVVEVLMWYGREVVGVEEVVGVGEVNDSGADLYIYRLGAVPFDRLRTGYVCLLANIVVL